MLKKTTIAILFALTLCVTAIAKETPYNFAFKTENLIEKIVASSSFKNYYNKNVEFGNLIVSTKTSTLFIKLVKKEITTEEETTFYKSLNLTKKEFQDIFVNIGNDAKAIVKEFPELSQMNDEDKKSTITKASNIAFEKSKVTLEFKKISNITEGQCFLAWLGCTFLCFSTCQNTECIWECSGWCGLMYGLCWFEATA